MGFRKEFPDFDPATLPVIPDGWDDVSWHNDACPCFDTGIGALVFIDYADLAMREYGGERFAVTGHPDGAAPFSDLMTDDWEAVLRYVDGIRAGKQ